MYTLSESLFLIGFVCLLMITFVLGESFLGIGIMGVFSLFLWAFISRQELMRIRKYPVELGLWIFFLTSLIVSSLFTHSLPLTLNSLFFYFFSFVFCFFWLIKKDTVSMVQPAILGLLLVGVALVINSLIFLVLPETRALLPDVTVLAVANGHNHLAAYLLLLLPLAWHMALTSADKRLIGLPLFLTLGLILSFGRVALGIGLFQMVVIASIYPSHKYVRWLFGLIVSLFIGLLVTKMLLGLTSTCPDFWLVSKLCRPFHQELRTSYWQQAVTGLTEHPLVGYGPGTFRLISLKHRPIEYAVTSYAHNAFLHLAAEAGIFVGLASLLWPLHVIYKGWSSLIKKHPSLETAAYLGFTSSAINVLFDFDWSFLGIFITTLLVGCLVIKPSRRQGSMWLGRVGVWLWYGSAGCIILTTCIYIITHIFLVTGASSLTVKYFPYFWWHQKLVLNTPLTTPELEKLTALNSANPEWLTVRLQSETDIAKRNQYIETIIKLDPWQRQYVDPVDHLLESSQYDQAEQTLVETVELLTSAEQASGLRRESLPSDFKVRLASQLQKLAVYKLQVGDTTQAGEYILTAYYYHEWAAAPLNTDLRSTVAGLPPDQKAAFLRVLAPIQAEHFGDNREWLAKSHLEVATASGSTADRDSSRSEWWKSRSEALYDL